jgi:hypothetical protein
MKAYFNNLPTTSWLLLVLAAVIVAYPIAQIVIPTVVHAVVPEVVRTLLHVI